MNAGYLNPDPRDHTDSKKDHMANLSDKNIIKAITEGGRGVDISPVMPVFGWTFSEYEIGALAAYVRTLHPNNAGPIDFSTLNRERPRMEFKEVEIRAPEGERTLKIGKGYYKRAGCSGCHKTKEYGGESGPALDGISSRKNARDT